jgi:hypothetical protein
MTHLFVKHPISFIDISNVAFILIESLSGKFAFFVDATVRCQCYKGNQGVQQLTLC